MVIGGLQLPLPLCTLTLFPSLHLVTPTGSGTVVRRGRGRSNPDSLGNESKLHALGHSVTCKMGTGNQWSQKSA